MMLAATFFGGVNIGADTIAKQFLDRQLSQTPVDVRVQAFGSSFGTSYITLDPSYWTRVRDEIGSVEGVKSAEVRSGFSGYPNSSTYSPDYFVHAIMDSSTVYADAIISGSPGLGVNETYVVEGSWIAPTVARGQQLTVYLSSPSATIPVSLNLTIAGTVNLGERAQAILNIYFFGGPIAATRFFQNILLISWEKTLAPILGSICPPQPPGGVCSGALPIPSIDVYLDRDSLINVFDIQSSIANVETVVARIQNVASREGLSTYPAITGILQAAAFPSFILRVFYVIISLPVFFIAWYMGGTVSQSSLNLRRREIGLLLAKGATKGQLARIFLGEALFVGTVGGALGLALAVLLNPVFVEAFGGQSTGSIFLSRETAIVTIVFTVILTLLSVWRPARRAASLSPLDALREYVYVEEVKGYKQTRPLIAFGLGLYKIAFLLLGINFLTLSQNAGGARSALVSLGLVVLTFLDFVLSFIGPFLFFWGASRIFAGGSARFQALIARFGRRILGELSQVASKNVYRNPARVAAITFLLALISGYGVWVTGQFASIQDHSVRQVFVNVGGEISVTTPNASSALGLATQLSQWSNVTAATPEIGLFSSFGSQARAIDPVGWRAAAYHEHEWFTGQGENAIFEALGNDPRTIILEKGVASRLQLSIGETFALTVSTGTSYSMRVVGFFGPDTSQAQVLGGPVIPSIFGGGWSYVSLQFWQSLPGGPFSSSRILVNAGQSVNATVLGESIQDLSSEYSVRVAERELNQVSNAPGTDIFQGILDVFRLGVVFAGLAASVGVGTVTYASFREREKETTIMAVRGVSYGQLLGILLMESLPIVVFSLVLGTAVGLLNVHGWNLSLNSIFLGQSFEAALAPYRVVLPAWVLVTLAILFGSILSAVIIPALMEARKTSEKMTRMVRLG